MIECATAAELIRIGIARRGCPHYEVAKAIGMSRATLSAYVKGQAVPKSFMIIDALERELRLDPGSLKALARADIARRRKPVAA